MEAGRWLASMRVFPGFISERYLGEQVRNVHRLDPVRVRKAERICELHVVCGEKIMKDHLELHTREESSGAFFILGEVI